MTEEEWNAERDKLRINWTGTGGDGYQTNIGRSVKGAERAFVELRAKVDFLTMALPDRVVHGLQYPACWHDVMRHAKEQGLV